MRILLAAIVVALSSPCVAAVQARDFGAIGDGQADDGPALRRALAAAAKAQTTLQLDAGRYRLLPESGHQFCLELDQATGVTIAGAAGTELVVADPAAGCFRAQGSTGVIVESVTIDYDPPPFTQGRIGAVDAAAGTIDLLIDEAFPQLDQPWFAQAAARWGMAFDAQERRLKADAPDFFSIDGWEKQPSGAWRVRLAGGPARLSHLAAGDRFVQLARAVGGGAVALWHCVDCVVESVTVRASNSVAVGLLACSRTRVDALRVAFAAGTKRLLTTDADGVHCQQNRLGPVIERCLFEGMADDAINIYTVPDVVHAVRSPVEVEVDQRCPIEAGDLLQVLDPGSGRVLGETAALAVAPAGKRLAVTFARPVHGITVDEDPKRSAAVYDCSASGEGYVIRGNTMRDHRRHGTLLRAGRGVVVDNTYERLGGFAVVVCNEPEWPEGPNARDITIVGNRAIGVGRVLGYGDAPTGASFQVHADRLGWKLADGYGQRGIVMCDNEVSDAPGAAVYIGSARDVEVDGLRVSAGAAIGSRRAHAAVEVEDASLVVVERLAVDDRRVGSDAAVLLRASVDHGEAGARIGPVEAKLPEGAASVRDERPSR
jgi:hypothetical protein